MSDSRDNEQFTLRILGPDGEVFSDDAESMLVHTRAGVIEILPRHEPLLAVLARGPVNVRQGRNPDRQICEITGGFLQVSDSAVTVLADGVEG